MPDSFGFETPQEAIARVRERFSEQQTDLGRTALGSSPGGQAGIALGQIFGPSIRKSLETRSARRSEAERLVRETGLSKQEARARAKQRASRKDLPLL